ncbi:MAG: PilZ domain-containing protein [Candidatus Omnitrophota bacterium]|jgi:Tfp pilus assembly protein PilZ
MENPDFREKRHFPRFVVSIPLNYFDKASSEMSQAQTYDISVEGLSVVTDKKIAVDTPLDIFLEMVDNREKIYRRGKVVWSNTLDDEEYKMGIKIEEPHLKPIPLVLRIIVAQRN